MAVVPFAVTKSGVPAVQRGIQRALLWVGLPIVALVAWAFQGGVQDPKLDTTDTQLVLKSLMLGQFVKANQWPASEGAAPNVFACSWPQKFHALFETLDLRPAPLGLLHPP